MNKLHVLGLFVCVLIGGAQSYNVLADAKEETNKIVPSVEVEEHQWEKTSTDFKMIHADTHEYTVWHNFIKKTRKCDITHKVRTDIWYCNLHDHTKSEVSLEETIHSHRHS